MIKECSRLPLAAGATEMLLSILLPLPPPFSLLPLPPLYFCITTNTVSITLTPLSPAQQLTSVHQIPACSRLMISQNAIGSHIPECIGCMIYPRMERTVRSCVFWQMLPAAGQKKS